MFDDLIGNDSIKRYLLNMYERQAIASSLLFAGPEGIGKSLFANAFAKMVICQNNPDSVHAHKVDSGNHPDIYHLHVEGKLGLHSIESMRKFSEDVYLMPYEASWKVFIIHDADRMHTYSANALLKTFEEPAKNTVIILLTSQPVKLLPTVLSRCHAFYFKPVPLINIQKLLEKKFGETLSSQHIQNIAIRSQGSVSLALQLAQQTDNPIREKILSLLLKGNLDSYKSLTVVVEEITALIEEAKKEQEEEFRNDKIKGNMADIPVAHQHQLLKEIEGSISLRQTSEVCRCFEIILSYYRDLWLLHYRGNMDLLHNPDYAQRCMQALQRGNLIPIETVLDAIAKAKLSLERSTSLSIILETLFLKLT